MSDISEKLTSEQSDEIYGVKTINWEDSSRKYLSLVGDEQVISLSCAQKSTYFQILYCVCVRYTKTLAPTQHGKKDWRGSKVHRNTETWIQLMVIEFEWNIFPGFTKLKLSHKVQESLLRLGETPENFTGRIIFKKIILQSLTQCQNN